MKKRDTLVFASLVAAAMIFGGALGATFLAKSTLTNVNAAQSVASPAPTSNEATAHESGESAAQEAAENNGTARPAGAAGAAGAGHPNEDPTHEAGESAAREAAENAATASPAPTTN
jgi:hypothetical protein